MTRTARAWLAARAAAVPPRLQSRMEEAVASIAAAPDAAVPHVLGEAALACLHSAIPRCSDRASALDLLAADALITYACEAAIEDDDWLDELCAAFSTDRLAAATGVAS